VRADPVEPQARLALAGALAALHRFDDSLAAAAEAARLGADTAAVDAARASALQGRGDLEAAVAIRKTHAAAAPDTTTLCALAAAEAEAGNLADAERHLDEAARLYRDTSPFAPAWIEFQRGLLRERRADLTGARAAYEAALRLLPTYAHATSHLAAIVALLGERERAIELLRPLAVADDQDPEYAAQLAALTGDGQLRERARTGYERLVARHPQAFSDHAARFYLATDTHRALALARRNLETRHTWDAFDLALTAARAARESSEACEIAHRALERGTPPARIRALADAACSTAR
jgi:tetratricopeptide (TPR) repeat protein